MLCSSCEKTLTYPNNNGIKIKRKDFEKTINGTWQIEHYWVQTDSTGKLLPKYDGVPIINNYFGEKGIIVIDYGSTFIFKWHGNIDNYKFWENNYYNFELSNCINCTTVDTNAIWIYRSISAGIWGSHDIAKLTPNEIELPLSQGILILKK